MKKFCDSGVSKGVDFRHVGRGVVMDDMELL